ncbi:hypothetical protein L6V77_29405 [Myxococcota bacterium]|nr:hypothetical protein [Myxococcota bacterium]
MSPLVFRFVLGASLAFNAAVVVTHLGFPPERASASGERARPGGGPLSPRLADRLGLDAAGRERLERLRAPVVAERAAFAEEAAAARAEMIGAIAAGDAVAAEAARTRLVDRQVTFQQGVVRYLAALGATLAPAERERLHAYLGDALFPGLGGTGHGAATPCAPPGEP